MWSEHLEPLAATGRRVIALDLPGFGEAGISPGEQAAWLDVISTMDELGIQRADLIGSSFGAAVALRVAAVAPSRITALVLSSASSPEVEPSPQLEEAWESEEQALGRGDVEAAVEAVLTAWMHADAPRPLRDRVARMQRRTFRLQQEATTQPDAADPLEEDPDLQQCLAMPALAVAGQYDMSDFVVGAEALAAAMPDCRSTQMRGVGHLAPLEAPREFRSVVLDFLESG